MLIRRFYNRLGPNEKASSKNYQLYFIILQNGVSFFKKRFARKAMQLEHLIVSLLI